MAGWLTVERAEVEAWLADSGAPGRLPELVRRLILETNPTVEQIDFPGDAGTRSSGFDGFVIARQPSLNVAAGRSVWELSVEKDANKKATEDYNLRLTAEVPDGTLAVDTTYVAVIPKIWTKAPKFAKDRTATGHWKEVRAIRLDQTVTWLEQAPATRLWFLEHLGKAPPGVELLGTWFSRWCGQTNPALTAELLLAGRDDSAKVIAATVTGTGTTTVVGQMGAAELKAVIASSFAILAPEVAERTVIIDDRESWRRMLKEPQPMILVTVDPTYADDVEAGTPHLVLIAVPHLAVGGIEVKALDGDRFGLQLRQVDDRLPEDLGALAGRSLVAVRRRLARAAELMSPPWARGIPTRTMRAALLVGEWDDQNEHDRSVVEAVAGTPYEAAREELLGLTAGDDPFIGRADRHWFVVSAPDSWLRLGPHLLEDDLRVFLEHARTILSELDTTAGANATERLVAQMRGHVRVYSQAIREGVAGSLGLFGANSDVVVRATGQSGEILADGVVRQLLALANADPSGAYWATLAPFLPELMEAAPTAALDALRKGSADPDPVLATAFRDKTDDMFAATSPHHSLQWALERVAWAPEHLTDACLQLARLVELDPGGRFDHRPDASLASILSIWHPGTSAQAEERFSTIDLIRKMFPEVGWNLLLALLPTTRGFLMGPNSPKFRVWKVPRVISYGDIDTETAELAARLLEDVGDNPSRWAQLIDVHTHLGSDQRAAIRGALNASVVPEDDAASSRIVVYEALRSVATHHHRHPDAYWALPESELAELDALVVRFTPTRPASKHAWLFKGHWVELEGFDAVDWRARDAEVQRRRSEAITEIESAGGLVAVIAFARDNNAQVVGSALADATEDRHLDWALGVGDEDPESGLARSLIWRRARQGALPWVESTIDSRNVPVVAQGRMLVDCNDYPASAEAAAGRGAEVESAYWTCFPIYGLGQDFGDTIPVARRMMDVGRPADALDLLHLYARQSPGNADNAEYALLVANGLERLREQRSQGQASRIGRGHAFPTFFALLDGHVDAIGADRVLALEWAYFGMLGFDPPDTYLHRRFATHPEWLMEILTTGFPSDTQVDRWRAVEAPNDEPDDDGDGEVDVNIKFQARRLIETWRVPPGLHADGFRSAECRAWVNEITPLAKKVDRYRVTMETLGEALVHAAGPDEWPTPEVAALVEDLASDHIEAGMYRRLRNLQGATIRGLAEGGTQERMKAQGYRERRDGIRRLSPRLARMLDELAKSYESEARMHDRSAERRRRGL